MTIIASLLKVQHHALKQYGTLSTSCCLPSLIFEPVPEYAPSRYFVIASVHDRFPSGGADIYCVEIFPILLARCCF
jgi:hypothetical protein